jgi:hypothetical protein
MVPLAQPKPQRISRVNTHGTAMKSEVCYSEFPSDLLDFLG